MNRRNIVALGAAWTLASLIAVCVAVLAVWWGGVNQDEGWYLYAARLVGEGKVPYRDFFFTQGPVLPYIYSIMPVHGLLSGRLVTFAFSVFSVLVAIAFARRLVSKESRNAVSLAVFAMLACNLYHMYFTSIPKTYALGTLFVMLGFLLLSYRWNFLAAVSFAFASGTRISLVLILGVVGVGLLVTRFRTLQWLWFGVGGMFGLFLVYGFFAVDAESLKGLLAAQAYHAGRGGFDPFFAAGAVCRLARGYLAAGAVMFAAIALGKRTTYDLINAVSDSRRLRWMAGMSFAAVFLLQLSAPFPYDDYQVPLMPLLAVLIAVPFAERSVFCGNAMRCLFPVLVSGMCAIASPLLQDWMTNGQDRFWSLKKDRSELAQMRDVARRLETMDPDGTMLLTQDLYLAVEMERKVPEGLEMGPFSYFPGLSDSEANSINVMNTRRMESLISSAPCKLAAFSGYGFAISVPKGDETKKAVQNRFRELLASEYEKISEVPHFGQNHTTLECFVRREPKKSDVFKATAPT
ncbi:MAG: hypothetical protein IJC66_11170, partial [Kiritimatiellae bacterium]|nr:hypothetical protein [Kiritimatiellia bacterium]